MLTTIRPARTEREIDRLAASRDEARMRRAEWLARIAEGRATPEQLVDAAADPFESYLRKLTLRRILAAQPGCGKLCSQTVLDRLQALLCAGDSPSRHKVPSDPTVSWLLHSQAPDRIVAWKQALKKEVEVSPWPGFPFSRKVQAE